MAQLFINMVLVAWLVLTNQWLHETRQALITVANENIETVKICIELKKEIKEEGLRRRMHL